MVYVTVRGLYNTTGSIVTFAIRTYASNVNAIQFNIVHRITFECEKVTYYSHGNKYDLTLT